MITETTPAISAENVPEELRERPQWVCWRYEERDSKPTKVPYQPNGKRASVTDLMTWSAFYECYGRIDGLTKTPANLGRFEAVTHFEAVGAPIFDGIGFVFSSADPFVGIDLDDCRDPETGEIASWAQKMIARVQEGYVEVSPSGWGVHIIVEGTVRDGGMRKKVLRQGDLVGEIEMYSRGRFFTITGKTL
jgi:primase-polymerase (primpol)-like protein